MNGLDLLNGAAVQTETTMARRQKSTCQGREDERAGRTDRRLLYKTTLVVAKTWRNMAAYEEKAARGRPVAPKARHLGPGETVLRGASRM